MAIDKGTDTFLPKGVGSLKTGVVRAVGWATATRFLAQLVNWAMTLATVHFLRPELYGLAAITTTIAAFISEAGSGAMMDVVVQRSSLSEAELPNIFGLVLVINAVCLVLICGVSYPAAWFYGEPQLTILLVVVSLQLIPMSFRAVPRALLDRRLDLKSVSRVDAVARILGGAFVFFLAWAGAGIWALILGPILVATLQAIGYGVAARYFQSPRFSFAGLAYLRHFGGIRMVEQLLWNIYISADVFIIGRVLSADLVGIYYVSRNLAALPVEKFSVTVRPVALPAFSLVQHDRSLAVGYLRKTARLLGFLSFPVLFGIAAVSPQAVSVALGPKWSAAATPVAILAVAMALRPIGLIIPSFLMGMGEFAASLRNTTFNTILFVVAFLIGSHWGLIGVCGAWLVAYPIQLLSAARRAAQVSGTTTVHLLSPLLAPLTGALIMFAAVRSLDAMLAGRLQTLAELLVLVAAGMIVYGAYTLAFMRPVARELLGLARPSRG